MRIEVHTQAELDQALAAHPDDQIVCVGDGEFEVGGSSTVTAWDSSTVHAGDSSTVHAGDSSTVTAWDSSTVTAGDSSTVTARDSSTVTARDSSTVHAGDSSTVTAGDWCAVHHHNQRSKVTAKNVFVVPDLSTIEVWAAYHGIPIADGRIRLAKAVRDDYRSAHDMSYKVGSEVTAPDWTTTRACGGGLHLVAQGWQGISYDPSATRFVAVEVAIADLVVIDGEKVKARTLRVLHETDAYGVPLAVEAVR